MYMCLDEIITIANDFTSGIFGILPMDIIGYINIHIEVICEEEY